VSAHRPIPKSRTGRKRMAAGQSSAATRAAIYGRLSLLTDETTSPTRQREGGERWVGAMSYAYDPKRDFYGDFDSVSGSKKHVIRPAFNQLMANLDRYDVIVVYKLDRLTRRLQELVEVLDILRERNIRLVAIEDGIDTGKGVQAQLLASIIGAVAQMEAETIGERVASAQEFMTRNGRYRGGQRPFGFRPAATEILGGHIFRQDPNEVTIIGGIIEQFLDGKSYRSIVKGLNEDGVEAPRARSMSESWEARKRKVEAKGDVFEDDPPDVSGYEWNVPAVKYLLSNPILMGHGRFGEDLIRDEQHGDPIEIAPPIVDESTYNSIVAKIEGGGQGGGGKPRGETLLSGIATCGSCGRVLISGGGRTYVCQATRVTPGSQKVTCEGVTITKARLDGYVLGWIEAELDDGRLTAAADRLATEEPTEPDDPFIEQRAEVNRKIARLREDRDLGLYDSPKDKLKYAEKIKGLQAELAEVAPPTTAHDDLAEILGERVTLATMLAAEPAQLRRFLRAALAELKVFKAGSTRAPVADRVELKLAEALEAPGRRRAR
jgi:site-specific DNA recombinase